MELIPATMCGYCEVSEPSSARRKKCVQSCIPEDVAGEAATRSEGLGLYRFELWRRTCASLPRDVHDWIECIHLRLPRYFSGTRYTSELSEAASLWEHCWLRLGSISARRTPPEQHASRKGWLEVMTAR